MKNRKYDVAILAVLTDCELPALLSRFGDYPIDKPHDERHGDRFWFVSMKSEVLGQELSIVITAVGQAGNADASAVTTSVIDRFCPELICLLGIAAGMKDDVNLGDVVVSERVFGYGYKKRKPKEDSLRPRHKEPVHDILQDVNYFKASFPYEEWIAAIREYVTELRREDLPVKKLLPKKQQVVAGTIASGDEVFGDGSLRDLKTEYGDDTIRVGEMEGIGFAIAASRKAVRWLVVRGVSDFGDPLSKDDRYKDRFHHYASISAAAYAFLFLRDGYRRRKSAIGAEQAANILSGLRPLKVRNVLITVNDKGHLEIPLKYFAEKGINVIATPNTAKAIEGMGFRPRTTFDYTRTQPLHSLRGTLHPYILGSIMADPGNEEHSRALAALGLSSIELVFTNSRQLCINDGMTGRDILEHMSELQIGGPALLRWTLKQWRSCAAVVEPSDYAALVDDLARNNNVLSDSIRLRLLRRAMQYITSQDEITAAAFNILWPSVE